MKYQFALAVLLTINNPVYAQDGCNTDIVQALQATATQTVSNLHEQLKLKDPPKSKDVVCLGPIYDFSIGGIITLPNIRKVIDGAIETTCNLLEDALNKVPTGANLTINPLSALAGELNGELGNHAGNILRNSGTQFGEQIGTSLPNTLKLPKRQGRKINRKLTDKDSLKELF